MKTKTIIQDRKSLSLKVEGDTLIIKRPHHVSQDIVDNFIEKKRKWIENQFKLNKKFQIDFGAPLIIFNEVKSLRWIKSKEKRIEKFDNLWLVYSSTERIGLELVKAELKAMLSNKIDVHLNKLKSIKDFNVTEIKIKNLTSSWGNCNHRKELSFAFRLIHCSHRFIEAVIAHEVSHLFEMNHSRAFYHVLSQFDPDYHSSIKDQ